MAKSEPIDNFPTFFNQVRAGFTVEIIGACVLVAGGAAVFSLSGEAGVPWLVHMAGWTAPLLVVSMLIAGGVMLLRERAGYWSAEALLGVETLLLALMAGTALLNNPSFSWDVTRAGGGGGLVGTALASLLTAGLGRGSAFFLVVVMGVAGFYWTVRYTPLVFASVYVARWTPVIADYWRWFVQDHPGWWSRDVSEHASTTPLYTNNFVAPYAPDEELEEEHYVAGMPAPTAGHAPTRPAHRAKAAPAPVAVAPAGRKRGAQTRRRVLPGVNLLSLDEGVYGGGDTRAMEHMIERTLEDFNVPARVVHVESGPTVTQFGVEPQYLESSGQRRKVRVNRIVNLADDLALALAAKSVRIEAPVPGRPYVGIEVPNVKKMRVALRGILESTAMQRAGGRLKIALGRDTAGAPVVMDLTQAPHLLIAGATGSGKSVCINAIVTGLLMQHGPDELQMVMIDPKMVELPGYNGIPHLIGKVITDMDQVMGALTWLMLQMDDRYRLFREAGVRNIAGYNELVAQQSQDKGELKPLPYIVLVVDELADLMMTAAEDVERQLCRLAQMARATGIHLLLATQRPSTDVVTGLIKANFPSRIAFAVTSQIDSRVILDQPGAERLLGQGDMLLMRPDASKLFRLQGCFVADDEIGRVVSFWRGQSDVDAGRVVPPWNGLLDQMDQEEEVLLDAIDLVRGMRTCSTSMLQRKLRVGYPKAARLMEQLEDRGVVGPDMGGGQGREVLLKDEDRDAAQDGEDDDLF